MARKKRASVDQKARIKFNAVISPRSENQKYYINSINKNDMVFCNGPAGSGKTYIAVACAVKALITNQVERIIITRPVVEAGESIGYLPGTAEEKLKPYMLPIFDELMKFASSSQISEWKNNRQLEIVPLGLMRGRNFHNSFMIGDEFQNATLEQIKMFLTRIGIGSKMIVTGDHSQSDLPRQQRGGFEKCINNLDDIENVGIIKLKKEDIVRNSLIPIIIERVVKISTSHQPKGNYF